MKAGIIGRKSIFLITPPIRIARRGTSRWWNTFLNTDNSNNQDPDYFIKDLPK